MSLSLANPIAFLAASVAGYLGHALLTKMEVRPALAAAAVRGQPQCLRPAAAAQGANAGAGVHTHAAECPDLALLHADDLGGSRVRPHGGILPTHHRSPCTFCLTEGHRLPNCPDPTGFPGSADGSCARFGSAAAMATSTSTSWCTAHGCGARNRCCRLIDADRLNQVAGSAAEQLPGRACAGPDFKPVRRSVVQWINVRNSFPPLGNGLQLNHRACLHSGCSDPPRLRREWITRRWPGVGFS